MLSSSDAKLRCLWHMVVWSVMLILVSQFLVLTEHIAFYIFAAFCNLLLPVITSIYSTTSGRHGAGLLRVFYVICDPVLACMTVLPPLLFTVLPELIDEHTCLSLSGLNETVTCLMNETHIPAKELSRLMQYSETVENGRSAELNMEIVRQEMLWEKHERMVTIQLSLIFPSLLTLAMGRRTRKMNYTTSILTAAYWLCISIELCGLIEIAALGHRFIHSIYTTEAIAAIAMILSTSYGAVTLCSYVSPMGSTDNQVVMKRFDYIYRCLVGIVGIVFAEIPLLVARCRILAIVQMYYEETDGTDPISLTSGASLPSRRLYGGTPPLPAAFYAFMVKDAVFVALISIVVVLPKNPPWCRASLCRSSCAMSVFDDPHKFEPEKRDVYIGRHRRERVMNEAMRDGGVRPDSEKKRRTNLPLEFSSKHRNRSKYVKRNGSARRDDASGQYKLVNNGNTVTPLQTVHEEDEGAVVHVQSADNEAMTEVVIPCDSLNNTEVVVLELLDNKSSSDKNCDVNNDNKLKQDVSINLCNNLDQQETSLTDKSSITPPSSCVVTCETTRSVSQQDEDGLNTCKKEVQRSEPNPLSDMNGASAESKNTKKVSFRV